MWARYITGAVMALLGANLIIVGLGFINGPFLFLSPFKYPAAGIQSFAFVVGSGALALGLFVLASTRGKVGQGRSD